MAHVPNPPCNSATAFTRCNSYAVPAVAQSPGGTALHDADTGPRYYFSFKYISLENLMAPAFPENRSVVNGSIAVVSYTQPPDNRSCLNNLGVLPKGLQGVEMVLRE
jgi:hypothetical protein